MIHDKKKLDRDLVKQAVSIESVIGSYIDLKPEGGGELVACCPFHDERTPSFKVTPSKGLFYCFGCHRSGDVFTFIEKIEGVTFTEAIRRVAEIGGLNPESVSVDDSKPRQAVSQERPRIVATYEYRDEKGDLVYEKVRIEPGPNGKSKDFRQRRKHPIDGDWVWSLKAGKYLKSSKGDWFKAKDDADSDAVIDELEESPRPLYRLPEVIDAETVYVVEGEKDVETLRGLGLVGTTKGGSSEKWLPEHTEYLRGKRVYIFPDQDGTGRKKGDEIAQALKGVAVECFVLNPQKGKDITEFVELGGSVQELTEVIERTLRQAHIDQLEKRGLFSAMEILDLFEGGYEALLNPASRAPGLMSGFSGFDEMTAGLRGGELIILAARPAMGKTALALNIGFNVSAKKKTVAIFSLEMSRESLLTRMMCSQARIDQQRHKKGYLNSEERSKMAKAFYDLSEMPIFIDDAAGTTLPMIQGKLADLKKRTGKLDLVIVDYLQLMSVKGKENRVQEVSALSRGLKVLAREFNVPFLVLSQLSRATESRAGDHRPQLSDLRESGSIEQDADIVTFLYREEYYKPDREDLKGIAEWIIGKQRNGPTGKIKLTFLNSITKFEDAAEPWREAA